MLLKCLCQYFTETICKLFKMTFLGKFNLFLLSHTFNTVFDAEQ